MRSALGLSLLLCLSTIHGSAQKSGPDQTTLTVRSTLVQIPALVKTKAGEVVFQLTADDFALTDDGVPQHLNLDPDTDVQPLALAICVQTGGAGAAHFADYQDLGANLDAFIGNVDHHVAVIAFDTTPHLLVPFTPGTDEAARQLANLNPGNPGAGILDAVAFAVNLLRAQPPQYRRAVLLLSETLDQGSNTTLAEALRLISDTNTTMYTFGFSSTHAQLTRQASKFNRPAEPGPTHGCFSRDGADAEYEGHYSKQVLDCLSQLAPPIRLATMAFLSARNGLRTKTTASIAELTGGEFFHFHNEKDLKSGLVSASHDVHNFYILSFRPTAPTPGLHAIHLEMKDRPQLTLKSRTEYWIDTGAAP